jgi:hydrogenase maturation factor
LHELAEAAGVGLEIFEDRLPYLPETTRLCQHFGLDPLGLIASGALLIAAEPGASANIVAALAQAGIEASLIGRVQPAEKGRVLLGEAGPRPLPQFKRDEIARLFE